MNSFRDLPRPAQGLKPMKQVRLQELMNLVVVIQLGLAFLKMLDPIETCVLNLGRKALFHLTTAYISNKHTRSAQVTDVLLEN
jgi:hypothetical protein